MLSDEQQTTIITKLNKKNINNSTIDYIIKYCEMNNVLFKNAIPIDEMIETLCNNINYNITYGALLNKSGLWNSNNGKISISIFFKLPFYKNSLQRTIYHELDHAATTNKKNLTEKQINSLKGTIKLFKNVPLIGKYIKFKLNKFITTKHYSICGFQDLSDRRELNEGVTEYKNQKYAKYIGINNLLFTHTSFFNGYYKNLKYTKRIADITGEQSLLKSHFNNDFDELNRTFNYETQGIGNLNEINTLIKYSCCKGINRLKWIRNLKAEYKLNLNLCKCDIAKLHKSLFLEFNLEKYKDINMFKLYLERKRLLKYKKEHLNKNMEILYTNEQNYKFHTLLKNSINKDTPDQNIKNINNSEFEHSR